MKLKNLTSAFRDSRPAGRFSRLIQLKIASLLIIAFLFDLLRPLGYFFLPSILFLTIISVALYGKFSFCFFASLLMGILQDSVMFSRNVFYSLLYPLLVLIAFSLNNYFYFIKMKTNPIIVKMILSFFLILTYVTFISFIIKKGDLFFALRFFIQSYLIFFLVDYLIQESILKK